MQQKMDHFGDKKAKWPGVQRMRPVVSVLDSDGAKFSVGETGSFIVSERHQEMAAVGSI